MRRFGLVMSDDLYDELYRLYPDHGQRTSLLRRCVHGLIKQARIFGGALPNDAEGIGNRAAEAAIREGE